MRVQQLIDRLQELYKPNERIIVSWWDKEMFLVPDDLDETGFRNPTDEEWNEAVDNFDRRGFDDHANMIFHETLFEFVYDVTHGDKA